MDADAEDMASSDSELQVNDPDGNKIGRKGKGHEPVEDI